MKKIYLTLFILVSVAVFTIPLAFGDEDSSDNYSSGKDSSDGFSFFSREITQFMGIKELTNPLYQEECSSCHMAYQPGLLPAKSWEKVLSNLDNHFGDNAELDGEDLEIIRQYLLNNAADTSKFRRSRQFSQVNKSGKIIDRITQSSYFRHEHDEIPIEMVRNNDKVRSFSHCNSCHIRAEKGLYDEHDVRIPGYGYWDD